MEAPRDDKRYELVPSRWTPDPGGYGPRRARRPVIVQAYVPAPLSALDVPLEQATVAAIADAEREIAATEAHAAVIGAGTLARQLLRSEAIASSQIEGVQVPANRTIAKVAVSGRRHPHAQAALAAAAAVADANRWAADEPEAPFTVDVLLRLHEAVARGDRHLESFAGILRDRQNWIGSDPHTPLEAEFVPPPPDLVHDLLEDLASFLGRTDLSPVLQAAVAHAQFETIHPFGDGNGRVGRLLIGMALARGGLTRHVIPPVSLVLSRDRTAYVEGLTGWRYSDEGPDRWVRFVARSLEDAAIATQRLADDVIALQGRWRERSSARSGSAGAAILDALVAEPIVDAPLAERLTGSSRRTAERALDQLERDGVLQRLGEGRRNRVWESVGHFALLDAFERDLSGGTVGIGETR